MLKKLLLFTFLLIGIFFINAQHPSLKLLDSIVLPKNKFQKLAGIDTQEFLFFINNGTVIKKKENQQWSYTNYELGFPTSISVINPLQVLVFYKESNAFVLLDRFLNETQRINLNTHTQPKLVNFVSNAQNREVWLFNSLTSKLEFFNYQNNINTIVSPIITPTPIAIEANFNYAYILQENNLIEYNTYGTLLKQVPIENAENLSLDDAMLFVKHAGNKLSFYNLKLEKLITVSIPKNSVQDVLLRHEKLYIYSQSTIYIYNLTIPSK